MWEGTDSLKARGMRGPSSSGQEEEDSCEWRRENENERVPNTKTSEGDGRLPMKKKKKRRSKDRGVDEDQFMVDDGIGPQDTNPLPYRLSQTCTGSRDEESGESEENGGDKDCGIKIPQDSFSMFYVATRWHQHLIPMATFTIQVSILSLIFYNLIQTNGSPLDLKMNVPVDVPIEVTIAQYIASVVSVFTAKDFVDGMFFARKRIVHVKRGHEHEPLNSNEQHSIFFVPKRIFRKKREKEDEAEEDVVPSSNNEAQRRQRIFLRKRVLRDTTRTEGEVEEDVVPLTNEEQTRIPPYSMKWEASNFFRTIEGLLVIAVSFVFIVQSTTVIDLFLNFAGVAFVSELDDVCFQLSEMGFLGINAKQLAGEVTLCKVHTETKEDGHRAARKTVRIASFALISLGMCAGLSFFASEQDVLTYACKSISITVGEAKFAKWRRFSGTYTLHEDTTNNRAVYVQKQGKGAFFAYCDKEKKWTLTLGDLEKDDNPCSLYDLQSKRTRTYDVTEIDELQYYTGDAADGQIKCNDCSTDPEREEETCGWYGVCQENDIFSGDSKFKQKTCECYKDKKDDLPTHFGESCQFERVCTELVFQEDEFPGYTKSFHLLYDDKKEPLMFNDRPAYAQNFSAMSDASISGFAVMLFDGGRWIVMEWREDNWPQGLTIQEYFSNVSLNPDQEYFSKVSFLNHSGLESLPSYSYISDLSYEGIPANIVFQEALTAGETDHSVGKLGGKEFILLCADCGEHDSSYCMDHEGNEDDGLCDDTQVSVLHHPRPVHRCKCEHGFIGPLCQTRPVEGRLVLHLEHGAPNVCSVCGENNLRTVRDLKYVHGGTCLPFPREPLVFDGANGIGVSRQIGLHLNETHFSVLVSNRGRFFPSHEGAGNDDAKELICSAQAAGSKEIYSISRKSVPTEQTHMDFAILLNNSVDFFGKIIDPGGIDCFTKSNINENECDGTMGNISKTYYNSALKKSNLMRVWVQFDLKVTQ